VLSNGFHLLVNESKVTADFGKNTTVNILAFKMQLIQIAENRCLIALSKRNAITTARIWSFVIFSNTLYYVFCKFTQTYIWRIFSIQTETIE